MLNKICTRTAKNAPCFVHSGWYQDSAPMRNFCSSLHSLSNTNALYCRAVRLHSGSIRQPVCLRKFIMTSNFRPLTGTQPFGIFCLPSPACPTLLANNNSRFCFLKFTKPAHEHYLQVLLSPLKPASIPSTGT